MRAEQKRTVGLAKPGPKKIGSDEEPNWIDSGKKNRPPHASPGHRGNAMKFIDRWSGQQSWRTWAPIATLVLCALTGYGATEIVLQLGLGRILATAVGFVAFVANLLKGWPQPEDMRD
jgi:hypothetical protein